MVIVIVLQLRALCRLCMHIPFDHSDSMTVHNIAWNFFQIVNTHFLLLSGNQSIMQLVMCHVSV